MRFQVILIDNYELIAQFYAFEDAERFCAMKNEILGRAAFRVTRINGGYSE